MTMTKLSEQQKLNLKLIDLIYEVANGDDKPTVLNKIQALREEYKKARGVK